MDWGWLGKKSFSKQSGIDRKKDAQRCLYVVSEVLIRLGYFINIEKSVFLISTVIKFLGMLVDSIRLAFLIPENKLDKFLALRREILSHDRVDINTLQKFAGKCISFLLAVPGAKCYTKVVNRAIGKACKNSGFVEITQVLREEIRYWGFLQDWTRCFLWRTERHLQFAMATDSSSYKWGALVFSPDRPVECSDFWDKGDETYSFKGDSSFNQWSESCF
jgi:hypothetical protein